MSVGAGQERSAAATTLSSPSNRRSFSELEPALTTRTCTRSPCQMEATERQHDQGKSPLDALKEYPMNAVNGSQSPDSGRGR